MTIDFSNMEDLEIQALIFNCNEELKKRENSKKDELIKAFQVAYANLRDEGIDIYYNGIEEEVEIKHFEDFSFL